MPPAPEAAAPRTSGCSPGTQPSLRRRWLPPRNPRDEMLCQDAVRRGAAQLEGPPGQQGRFAGSTAGRALLPAVTRSPLLRAPCHWMSRAVRGSRLRITWRRLRHPPPGETPGWGRCRWERFRGTWRDTAGDTVASPPSHHQQTPPGPSTNLLPTP